MSTRKNSNITRPPFIVDARTIVRNSGRQIDWSRVGESYRSGALGSVVVGVAGAAQGATSIPIAAVTFNIPVGTVLDFGGAKFARLSAPYTAGGTTLTVDALVTALVSTDTAYVGRTGAKYLPAGTVIGEALGSGKVSPRTTTGSTASSARGGGVQTGNGTMGTVTVNSDAQSGVYTVEFAEATTNLGDFDVFDPQGRRIGRGVVGTAFNTQLGFTIADGSTDFAVGDSFLITVAIGNPATGILETDAYENDYSAGQNGYGIITGGVIYENLLPEATGNPKVLATAVKNELNAAGTGFQFEQYGDTRS